MEKNFIYGLHPVEEALNADTEITKIYISNQGDFKRLYPLQKIAEERNISVTKVPNVKLDKLVAENHQGIIAKVSPIKYWDLEVLIAKIYREQKHPVLVYLDGVTDTRNLGGIARSAACLDIHGIILPAQGSAGVTDDTIKTSAGAILKIPVARIGNAKLALHTAMAEGFNLVAITEKTEDSLEAANFDQPTLLILGGEQKGINNALLNLANNKVKIPMKGGVSSLNVSVALGITGYEIMKQRASVKKD